MGCTKEQTLVGKSWLVRQSLESSVHKQRRLPCHSTLEMITAVKLGDLDSVRQLLSSGKVGVESSYRGSTALGLAVARGDTEMVKLLCQFGADVNKPWKDQAGRHEPPLVTVARLGHTHLARLLLPIPHLNVDQTDAQGRTALWVAVEQRRPLLVSLLVAAGCRLDILPVGCQAAGSVLHLAIRSSGYISGQETAFCLVQAGAELGVKDSEGRTPLAWAVYVNNLELVEELIRLGSNPWEVGNGVMEVGGQEVVNIVRVARRRVGQLQELLRKEIRSSVSKSRVAAVQEMKLRQLNFVDKMSTLPLPHRMIEYLL